MLPKKRMEEDAERGLDTLQDGERAFRTFQQTLVLHLGKHIDRMVAAGIYNDESQDAEEPAADHLSVSYNQSPQKRSRAASAITGGKSVSEVDREMTANFAQDSGEHL